MSVEILNTTTVPVKISEGSAGVFHEIGVINRDKPFNLRVDMNVTYREYLLTTIPEDLPVGSSLTSDDVLKFSKIEIEEERFPDDCPVWIGTPIVKRRGVFTRFLKSDPPAEIQIVNSLKDQNVEVVENQTKLDERRNERCKLDHQSQDQLQHQSQSEDERQRHHVDEPKTDDEPKTVDGPKTEEKTKTDDEPSTDDGPKTEEKTKTDDEPNTDNGPKTVDGPKTEEKTKTDDEPNTDDGPKTEEKTKTDDEPNTDDGPKTEEKTKTDDGLSAKVVLKIAPEESKSLSLPADSHHFDCLRTSPEPIRKLACWKSAELKSYSKIEICFRREYFWTGIPFKGGSSVPN